MRSSNIEILCVTIFPSYPCIFLNLMPQCRVKVTAQLSHGNEEQPSQRNGKLLRNTTYIKKLHSITRFNTRSSLAALLPTIFPEEGKDGAPINKNTEIQQTLFLNNCSSDLLYQCTLVVSFSPIHHFRDNRLHASSSYLTQSTSDSGRLECMFAGTYSWVMTEMMQEHLWIFFHSTKYYCPSLFSPTSFSLFSPLKS